MPRLDVGPRIYHQGTGVATLSYTPMSDRSAVIKRILIDKPSASDTWRLFVGPSERAAFDIRTTGNQQPLSGPTSAYPKNNDFFTVARQLTGMEVVFPVPNGLTATIKSDGGATANISLSMQEMYNEELNTSIPNHPLGSRLIIPLVIYRAATVTAVNETDFDTQIGPAWVPSIAVPSILPSSWRYRVLAYFLEGGGRNTFSGSADHLSVSQYFVVKKNGTRLYTRDVAGGIPIIGQAAAAGSANTVVGSDLTPKPAFQEANLFDTQAEDVPFVLGAGDNYEFMLDVSGDVTGGADYSLMRQMFICDITYGVA